MSLIEVLLSLVILSIGVLAVVALQLISKRNNADAGGRSVGAQLAYNMIERMRLNPDLTALPVYVTAAAAGVGQKPGAPPGTGFQPAPNPDCSTATANCQPAQLASYDVWVWEQNLLGDTEQAGGTKTGGLVQPTACITGPAAGTGPIGSTSGLYTVTVVWRGSVQIPDIGTAVVPCGADPQTGGTNLYSQNGSDNVYRRTAQFQVYITCRVPPGTTGNC